MREIIALRVGDPLWEAARDYARACSWRAGQSLARDMDGRPFADWERVFVAIENGEMAGYCTALKTDCIPDVDYTPYIGYVFVGEAHRGHRLSQALIDRAAGYLAKLGYERVYLVSDHENLYEKYGFTVVDRRMAPWGEVEKIYMRPLAQKPFWEALYADANASAFGAEPNATVVRYAGLCDPAARALEVGCGEGQNALYLARRGFARLEAFDLSPGAVAKLRAAAAREGLSLDARAEDLREFRFAGEYGLVLSFGTLHFVDREEWRRFLTEAKAHTAPGGLHIMQIFTDALPPSPDIAPFAVGLAREGELREVYADWEILEFQSYAFWDEHPGVPRHQHAADKLVARRKG